MLGKELCSLLLYKSIWYFYLLIFLQNSVKLRNWSLLHPCLFSLLVAFPPPLSLCFGKNLADIRVGHPRGMQEIMLTFNLLVNSPILFLSCGHFSESVSQPWGFFMWDQRQLFCWFFFWLIPLLQRPLGLQFISSEIRYCLCVWEIFWFLVLLGVG